MKKFATSVVQYHCINKLKTDQNKTSTLGFLFKSYTLPYCMETLPQELITHIGRFLPLKDRWQCLLAAKCFQSINYHYTHHTVVFKDPAVQTKEFASICKYVHRVKPKCTTLGLAFRNLVDVQEIDLEGITRAAYRYAFFKVTLTIVHCDPQIIARILNVFQPWALEDVLVHFEQIHTLTTECIDALEQLQTASLRLVLQDLHLSILNYPLIMRKISIIEMLVYNRSTRFVELKHLDKAETVVIQIHTKAADLDIRHAYNLTHLYISDMIWELLDDTHALSTSFIRYYPKFKVQPTLKLKAVHFGETTTDVKMSHVYENFWYSFIETVSKSPTAPANPPITFYYSTHMYNCHTVSMLKKMLQKGAKCIGYEYHDNNTYLLSKVFQHIIPDLRTKVLLKTHTYSPPPAWESMDYKEVFKHLTEDARDKWHWIQYL